MNSLKMRMLWIKQLWTPRKQTQQLSGTASVEKSHQNESKSKPSVTPLILWQYTEVWTGCTLDSCRETLDIYWAALKLRHWEVPTFSWHDERLRSNNSVIWQNLRFKLNPTSKHSFNGWENTRACSSRVIRKLRYKPWERSCQTSRILFYHSNVHGCGSCSPFSGRIKDWGSNQWACNAVTANPPGRTVP